MKHKLESVGLLLIALIILVGHHPKELGKAAAMVTVNPSDPVIYHSYGTWVFTYHAGDGGVVVGGGIGLTVPGGWSVPQIADPTGDGYVTVATDGSARLSIEPGDGQPHDTIVWVTVHGSLLQAGEKIIIRYGDTSGGSPGALSQGAAKRNNRFTILDDADGDGRYSTLEESPVLTVLPDSAAYLHVVAPSLAVVDEPFVVKVSVLDDFGNLVHDYTGTLEISSGDPAAVLPEPYHFKTSDRGHKDFSVRLSYTGFHTLSVNDSLGLSGESNPIRCGQGRKAFNLYWGDIHGHTQEISDGMGTVAEYYYYARNAASLDFAATSDHDHNGFGPLSQELWQRSQQGAANAHRPGDFVTLFSYEYTNFYMRGGHKDVYYLESGHPLYSCYSKISERPEQLFPLLNQEASEGDVMAIPHHTPRGTGAMATNWDYYDRNLMRLVEIYSVWGNSENSAADGNPFPYPDEVPGSFVQDGLARGYRMGFIGSSDTHFGMPGNPLAGGGLHPHRGGFAAVYGKDLTRLGIWKALYNRRCYATTGKRIILWFSINDLMMGQAGTSSDPPKADIVVAGTAPIATVEIVKNNGVAYTFDGDGYQETVQWIDGEFSGSNYYYVRVTQTDGEMAWSSPIWIDQRR